MDQIITSLKAKVPDLLWGCFKFTAENGTLTVGECLTETLTAKLNGQPFNLGASKTRWAQSVGGARSSNKGTWMEDSSSGTYLAVSEKGSEGKLLLGLTVDGKLDEGFGSQGILRLPENTTSVGMEEKGGRLLIHGTVTDSYGTEIGFLGRFLRNGTPDPEFASGEGWMTSPENGSFDGIDSLSFLSDGTFLLEGKMDERSALFGYSADGVLNTSFGENGVLLAPPCEGGAFLSVREDPAGTLVVKASLCSADYSTSTGAYGHFGLDGKPLSGFANGAGWIAAPEGMVFEDRGFDRRKDGSLLVTAKKGERFVLLRYGSDGVIDPSFAGSGMIECPEKVIGVSVYDGPEDGFYLHVTIGHGEEDNTYEDLHFDKDGHARSKPEKAQPATSVAAEPTRVPPDGYKFESYWIRRDDGSLITEATPLDPSLPKCLVRYHADGTQDRSFAQEGLLPYPEGVDSIDTSLIALKDGSLLAVCTPVDENECVFILRILGGGVVDGAFGNGGRLAYPLSIDDSDLTIDDQGRIVLTGSVMAEDSSVPFKGRFLPDGQPDPSFSSGNGYLTFPEGFTIDASGLGLKTLADGGMIAGVIPCDPSLAGKSLAEAEPEKIGQELTAILSAKSALIAHKLFGHNTAMISGQNSVDGILALICDDAGDHEEEVEFESLENTSGNCFTVRFEPSKAGGLEAQFSTRKRVTGTAFVE
jgi:uncharacterized delta-60 repeat protein